MLGFLDLLHMGCVSRSGGAFCFCFDGFLVLGRAIFSLIAISIGASEEDTPLRLGPMFTWQPFRFKRASVFVALG